MNTNRSPILKNVFWIGGSSGSAKSTVAKRIADEFEIELYSIDAMVRNHRDRYTPAECPKFAAFVSMSMDERWANRTPQEMHDSFHWFHGEGFRFILEDLEAMSQESRVLAEGYHLLPSLVKPSLDFEGQAVWLISTPEFRRKAFTERGSLWKIPNKTSKPEKALSNHLERERIFANRLTQEVESTGLEHILVDGSLSEEELFASVKNQFVLGTGIEKSSETQDQNARI